MADTRIAWGPPPTITEVTWGQPFTFRGDNSSSATWKWEAAFKMGQSDALKLLEQMDRTAMGIYYQARSQEFARLKKDGSKIPEDAIQYHHEIAQALLNHQKNDPGQVRTAIINLLELQIKDGQEPLTSSFTHSLSEIHSKALQFLPPHK